MKFKTPCNLLKKDISVINEICNTSMNYLKNVFYLLFNSVKHMLLQKCKIILI